MNSEVTHCNIFLNKTGWSLLCCVSLILCLESPPPLPNDFNCYEHMLVFFIFYPSSVICLQAQRNTVVLHYNTHIEGNAKAHWSRANQTATEAVGLWGVHEQLELMKWLSLYWLWGKSIIVLKDSFQIELIGNKKQ